MGITAADLPRKGNRIYHLDITPSQIASNIILVGDPHRVPLIAKKFLKKIEVKHEHRGLVVWTGRLKSGKRLSLVSTGMGTASMEIVLNEIAALHYTDPKTGKKKSAKKDLVMIRVGTSGALQTDTVLGTPIITEYAVGLDSTGLYYQRAAMDESVSIEKKARSLLKKGNASKRFTNLPVYASMANKALVHALYAISLEKEIPVKKGITITCSGFFANQGRWIGSTSPSVPNIDGILSKLEHKNLRAENMEMETSFLLHYARGANIQAAAVCAAIANRRKNTFAKDIDKAVMNAVEIAITAIDAVGN